MLIFHIIAGTLAGAIIGALWSLIAIMIGGLTDYETQGYVIGGILLGVGAAVGGALGGRKFLENRQRAVPLLGDRVQPLPADRRRLRAQVQHYQVVSQRTFASLPELLADARTYLDAASEKLLIGLAVPFWKDMAAAADRLAALVHGFRAISAAANRYQKESASFPDLPPFTVPTGKLPDPQPLADRLVSLAQSAQRQAQFAAAYQQCRNQTLPSDDSQLLSEAVTLLDSQIQVAIEALSKRLRVPPSELFEPPSKRKR
jgi:hypothetical protein